MEVRIIVWPRMGNVGVIIIVVGVELIMTQRRLWGVWKPSTLYSTNCEYPIIVVGKRMLTLVIAHIDALRVRLSAPVVDQTVGRSYNAEAFNGYSLNAEM